MVIGILTAAAVVGVIAFALLLIFRKDLVGVDLSGRSLLRLYLYLASLVGILVFAIGVAAAIDWGTAAVFGGEVAYGRPPISQPCPAGEKCVDPAQLQLQYTHENEQRQQRDLLRGLTLIVFGGIFWGAHRLVRGSFAAPDEQTSALRRAYDVLGTFVFGLAAVVMVPVGTYFTLFAALIPAAPDVFRQGIADSLSGGLVALPFWLLYLLRVMRAARAEPAAIARPRPAAVPAASLRL